MRKQLLSLIGACMLMLSVFGAVAYTEEYRGDLTGSLSIEAYTSSTYEGDFQGDVFKVFDEVRDTFYNGFRTAQDSFENQWIQVDFGVDASIRQLSYQADGEGSYRYGMKNFTIQASTDGKTWTDQFTGIAEQTSTMQEFRWTPTGSFRYWRVFMKDNHAGSDYFAISEMDMMGKLGAVAPLAPTLTAKAEDTQNMLTWKVADPAIKSYNVKRSATAGGPYTTLATLTDATSFVDTTATRGVNYYYIVTAADAAGVSTDSNEVAAQLIENEASSPTLQINIAESSVSVGQSIEAEVTLKNATNIYAEDFTVSYDTTLFDYVDVEAVTGYKIYHQSTNAGGMLRFIVASQGQANGITGEKTFLKLKLKAKALGIGKVDALKCRIADMEKEFDLNAEACTEDTVVIENTADVNRNGEYTLLDLAIDGYYFGQLVSNADPTKYNVNQAGDASVTNEDLVYIVNQMLANTKYAPNNQVLSYSA